MNIIVFGGFADTGSRLVSLCEACGWTCWVTSRSERAEHRSIHVDPSKGPGEVAAALLDGLSGATPDAVVNLIGAWLHDPRAVIYEGTRTILRALELCSWRGVQYIHCSATSVYGDRPGEVLDESSEPSPELLIGRVHLETETLLRECAHVREISVRLPHIYGPGRERTFEMMMRGELGVAGSGENVMQHLHVEDVVGVLVAVLERGTT
ncbi:MAG: NAD-dependent epimerase/dehydratase family protein, partial [Myxococcota bacterium]